MNFKIFGKLSVFFLIFLLIGFGCKGLTQEERAAIQPVTINYWTVFDDVETLRTFAKEYKEIRSYVNINIRQVRYEEFDNLFVNALADDVAPDLVSMHSRWLKKYQNRLMPMPRGVTVSRVFVKGKYQPEIIVETEQNLLPTQSTVRRNYVSTVAEDVILENEIYGLPLAMDTLALYYNTELLDKAGIALPPESWTELSEAVKKATRYDNSGNILQSGISFGTGNNIDNAADILMMLMLQNGVEVTDENFVTFALGLNRANENHPALQSLQFYSDFAKPNKDVYAWNENFGNALEEFARGKAVFYVGFAHDRARIQAQAPQLDFSVVSIPQLNPQFSGNVANYWVESVVKRTKNPNEAWDFVRYISSPENVKRYLDATLQPSPLRAQVAEQQGDPLLEPFASQVLTAKNWYKGRDYEAAKQAFVDLLGDYLQPYGEGERPFERDSRLLIQTQQKVQQTY